MNVSAIKLYIDGLCDAKDLIESVAIAKGFKVAQLLQVEKLAMDIPGMISSFGEMKEEAGALDPAEIADLEAYVASKLSAEPAKAQAIVSKALALAYAAYELEQAISAPAAAAPAPEAVAPVEAPAVTEAPEAPSA